MENVFSAVRVMTAHWWVLLLRGVLAILFGVLTFLMPGLSLAALVLLWGAYALVDGIFEVVAGVRGKWWGLVFLGLLGIAAGVVTFLWPQITAIALLWVIAFWAIFIGVLQIVAAVRLRKEIRGEWLWILAGLCTVLLGVLLILNPGAGALSVLWLIGTFAIVWGILLVILSFKLKGLGGGLAPKPAAATA